MIDNTLISIMSHGDPAAQATFDRHKKEWQRHDTRILVFSPSDKPVKTIHPQLSYGTASHHDDKAIGRFRFLMEFLSKTDFDHHFIFEYDSFLIGELPLMPPIGGVISGTAFPEDHPENWGGSMFIHPPLYANKIGMKMLHNVAKEFDGKRLELCQGFWDRFLGGCVDDLIGADVFGDFEFINNKWGVDAWSANTIQNEDIPEVVQAVKNGVRWIHGCKSEKAYLAIKEAMK